MTRYIASGFESVFTFAGQAWAHINKMFIKLISDVIITSVGFVIPYYSLRCGLFLLSFS